MSQMRKKRPVGRPPKTENQRERILVAAAELIAKHGYEQCSMADIAKKLGLTRPALYHYFATKQEIITDIGVTITSEMFAHVRARVDAAKGASASEQLEAQMTAHAEYFDTNYWMMVAGMTAYGGITRRELSKIDEIDAYRNGYESIIVAILRRGMRGGEFRKIDVKATTLAIYQLLNISLWYRPGGKKTAVDVARENYELVRRGIEKR